MGSSCAMGSLEAGMEDRENTAGKRWSIDQWAAVEVWSGLVWSGVWLPSKTLRDVLYCAVLCCRQDAVSSQYNTVLTVPRPRPRPSRAALAWRAGWLAGWLCFARALPLPSLPIVLSCRIAFLGIPQAPRKASHGRNPPRGSSWSWLSSSE